MKEDRCFLINPGWRLLLTDLGIQPIDVIRHAGLPEDLISDKRLSLSTDEYFRLWRAVELEARDPLLPIKLIQALSVEMLDPSSYAALCSPNLKIALRRISRYKRLVMPMELHLQETQSGISLGLKWLNTSIDPPASLVLTELLFFVQLARIGTRETIMPINVTALERPEQCEEYKTFFGTEVMAGELPSLTFSEKDATRPFLTANDFMWQLFEPQFEKQLKELENCASMSERVNAALLELLPDGNANVESVSRKLGVSARSLQRRLKEENNTFRAVLKETRQNLALHYLTTSHFSGAEISFLLGYEDPGSFFRAINNWTGRTAESIRADGQILPR